MNVTKFDFHILKVFLLLGLINLEKVKIGRNTKIVFRTLSDHLGCLRDQKKIIIERARIV